MASPQPLDPEVAAVVEDLPALDLDLERLATVRARQQLPQLERSGRVEVVDVVVPADPDVAVRVHRPRRATGPLPAVVSMHGGGYVMGDHRSDDVLFERWCDDLGLVGISVGYRLAPEVPYPGALDDCYAALRWAHAHAAELGVDPACIGVRGVSAGGGLAAALAILARDRGEVPLAFQLLDCPMLDDRQITPSSRLDGLPVWSRSSNAFGWRCYLGDLAGTDDIPPTAAPARAVDLRGLPPAFVSVGSVDGFLDEDVDYARRLNQAGVPCELHVYAGAPHGYQLAARSEVARRAHRDATTWLAARLAASTSGRSPHPYAPDMTDAAPTDDQMLAVVERLWDQVWRDSDVAALDDLMADRYVRHNAAGTETLTRAELKDSFVQYQRVLHAPVTTVDAWARSGDTVFIRATSRGVNIETQRPQVVTWMVAYRFEGSRIAEGWVSILSDVDWES